MPANACPAEWLLERTSDFVGCAICAVLRGMLAYGVFCPLAVANEGAESPCC